MNRTELFHTSLLQLVTCHPYLRDFFAALGLTIEGRADSLEKLLESMPGDHLDQMGLAVETMLDQCLEFIDQMVAFQARDQVRVHRVTIRGGQDKSGQPEMQDLELRAGEVVCVVGPTGSGKSQLLADMESLAQRDTPSMRQILLNGQVPDEEKRLSGEQQLVAQLSQNMNFVMDLSVREFVTMHAESRLVSDVFGRVQEIFSLAVELAGEPFTPDTPVTALSGGQSRALMIADVACLSASPIVLIDEIENAGVDRLRALDVLVREEKMVLMATHDPLLALSGDRRVVIKNGGISAVITTSDEERAMVARLAALDKNLARLRDQVRRGEPVVFDPERFMF
jgi:ABC-type lipoprotein export system ATPase subunit